MGCPPPPHRAQAEPPQLWQLEARHEAERGELEEQLVFSLQEVCTTVERQAAALQHADGGGEQQCPQLQEGKAADGSEGGDAVPADGGFSTFNFWRLDYDPGAP